MEDTILSSLPVVECEICSYCGPALRCQNYDSCPVGRCLYCVGKTLGDRLLDQLPTLFTFTCETCTKPRAVAGKLTLKAQHAARKPLPHAADSDDDLLESSSDELEESGSDYDDDMSLQNRQKLQQKRQQRQHPKQQQKAAPKQQPTPKQPAPTQPTPKQLTLKQQATPKPQQMPKPPLAAPKPEQTPKVQQTSKVQAAAKPQQHEQQQKQQRPQLQPKHPGRAPEAPRPAKRAAEEDEPKALTEISQLQRSKKPKADVQAGQQQDQAATVPLARTSSGQDASTSAPQQPSSLEAARQQPGQLPSQHQGQQEGQELQRLQQERQGQQRQLEQGEVQGAALPSPSHMPEAPQHRVHMPQDSPQQQLGKAPVAPQSTAIRRSVPLGVSGQHGADASAAGATVKKRPPQPGVEDATAVVSKKPKLPPLKAGAAATADKPGKLVAKAAAAPPTARGVTSKPGNSLVVRKHVNGIAKSRADEATKPGVDANAAGKAVAGAKPPAKAAKPAAGAPKPAAGEAPPRWTTVTTPIGPTASVPVANDGVSRATQQQAQAQRLAQQRQEAQKRQAEAARQAQAQARLNPLQRLTSGMEAEKELLNKGAVEVSDDDDSDNDMQHWQLGDVVVPQAQAADASRAPSCTDAITPRKLWEGSPMVMLDQARLYQVEVPLVAFRAQTDSIDPASLDSIKTIKRWPSQFFMSIVPWTTFHSKIPDGHVLKRVGSVAFHEKHSLHSTVHAMTPVIRHLMDKKGVLYVQAVPGVDMFMGLQLRQFAEPSSQPGKRSDWPFGANLSHIEDYLVLLEAEKPEEVKPWSAVNRPVKSSLKGTGSGSFGGGSAPGALGAVMGMDQRLSHTLNHQHGFASGMIVEVDNAPSSPHAPSPIANDGATAMASLTAAADAVGHSGFMGSEMDMDFDTLQAHDGAGDAGPQGVGGDGGDGFGGLGEMWDDDGPSQEDMDGAEPMAGSSMQGHDPIGNALSTGLAAMPANGPTGTGSFSRPGSMTTNGFGAPPLAPWASGPTAPAAPPPNVLAMGQPHSVPVSASSPHIMRSSPPPPLPSGTPPPMAQPHQQPAVRFAPPSMSAPMGVSTVAGPSHPAPIAAAPVGGGTSTGHGSSTWPMMNHVRPEFIQQALAMQRPKVARGEHGAARPPHDGTGSPAQHGAPSTPPYVVLVGTSTAPGAAPQDPRRQAKVAAPASSVPNLPLPGDVRGQGGHKGLERGLERNGPPSSNRHEGKGRSPREERSQSRDARLPIRHSSSERGGSGSSQRHSSDERGGRSYSSSRDDRRDHQSGYSHRDDSRGHGSRPRRTDEPRGSLAEKASYDRRKEHGSKLPPRHNESPRPRNGDRYSKRP